MWFSKYNYNVPPVAPVTPSSEPTTCDGYSIGMTDDDRTLLQLTSGYTTLSLTLNDPGVRRMIKMLDATLPEKDLSETNKE